MSHSLPLFFFFPHHFFPHPPISSPIPIKYLFFSSTHYLVSSLGLLAHPKYSSSSSPKRQEERNILHTQKMREEEAATAKEESRNRRICL